MTDRNAKKDAAVAAMARKQQTTFGMYVGAADGENTTLNVARRTSGVPSLDIALAGGIPFGGLIEIYGAESTGKTTLALMMISIMQEEDPEAWAGFVDVEHALNMDLVRALNVDTSRLLITQPDSGEQALQILREWCDSGLINIAVLDSTAALVLESDLQKSADENNKVAGRAALLSSEIPKLLPSLKKNGTTLIALSQLRSTLSQYGNPIQSTGGSAVRFYASQRIKLNAARGDKIMSGKTQIGTKVRAIVEKNKLGAPFREADWNVIFGKGIDREDGIFTLAQHYGIIGKPKPTSPKFFVYYDGPSLEPCQIPLGTGMATAREALTADENLLGRVDKAIRAARAFRDTGNPVTLIDGALPNPEQHGEEAVQAFVREKLGEDVSDLTAPKTLYDEMTGPEDPEDEAAF